VISHKGPCSAPRLRLSANRRDPSTPHPRIRHPSPFRKQAADLLEPPNYRDVDARRGVQECPRAAIESRARGPRDGVVGESVLFFEAEWKKKPLGENAEGPQSSP